MKLISRYLTLILIVLLPLISCKKSNDGPTKPYMEGELKFAMPEFVRMNSQYTLTASGVTKPENPEYRWVANSMFKDTITAVTITVTTPDSIGTFAIHALAHVEGYYDATATKTFTTVDKAKGKSLTGVAKSLETFEDPRDGISYDVVTIGSLKWFAQNLAWNGTGYAFHDSPAMDEIYGRMYTWDQATGGVASSGLAGGPQGACPEGWSVPTREDWEDLAAAIGTETPAFSGVWTGAGNKLAAPAAFNKKELWPFSIYMDCANSYGWNALPIGCLSVLKEDYSKFGTYAFFWSSAEKDADLAYYRYIYYDSADMPSAFSLKDDFCASVRCVKLNP